MGKEQDKYLDIHRVSNTIRCEELYIIFIWNRQMLWLWFAGNRGQVHSQNSPESGPQLKNFYSIIPNAADLKMKTICCLIEISFEGLSKFR